MNYTLNDTHNAEVFCTVRVKQLNFVQRSIPLSSDCCPLKHTLLKRSQNSSSSCWEQKNKF